jgi:hypothetical protein
MHNNPIQSLAEAKQLSIDLLNQRAAFVSPSLNGKTYAYRSLATTIVHCPELPYHGIFNSFVISQPSNSRYFSISFKPMRKPDKSDISNYNNLMSFESQRSHPIERHHILPDKSKYYTSDFFLKEDALGFVCTWIRENFTESTIHSVIGTETLESYIQNYQIRFRESQENEWGKTKFLLRFCEIRNDVRVIALIHPLDLHPEISYSSLEELGLTTPFMSLMHTWFHTDLMRRLAMRISFSFSEEVRFPMSPTNQNNEQVFKLAAFGFLWDETDLKDVVKKGARRQLKFYRNYFLQIAAIYGRDFYDRLDLSNEEKVTTDFLGESVKYVLFKRTYSTPEFDLFVSFHPLVATDGEEREYLDFEMFIHYRPVIQDRSQETKWTWHHVLEDLDK